MTKDRIVICSFWGGSHSYGLNTPASDRDERGVFTLTDLDKIMNPHSYLASGCSVWNSQSEEGEDLCYYELRHFLHLLRRGNTQSLETMFNTNWFSISPLFKQIIRQRGYLIDPESVHNSIAGYSHAEYKLAIGERTGKLGGKRQTQVDKHGFSPKNWCNLLRILYCGEKFFETGQYPVNMKGEYIHPQLMEIKTSPDRFTVARLNEMYAERKTAFEASWTKNKDKICCLYEYDQEVCADVVLNAYRDLILKLGKVSWLDNTISYFRKCKF